MAPLSSIMTGPRDSWAAGRRGAGPAIRSRRPPLLVRLRGAAATVTALVSLAACGSGGTPVFIARHGQTAASAPTPQKPTDSTTPGPIKPACQLVSRDEIAAALGNPVTAPVGQGPNCSWGTAVDGGTSASVTAVKPGAAQAATACGDLRLGQPPEGKHEAVTGVGTSAVWVYQPLTTLVQGSLVACWADSAVLVLLTGERDAVALRNTAIVLAQKVHTR